MKKNTGTNNNVNVSNHINVHGCCHCGHDGGRDTASTRRGGIGCLHVLLFLVVVFGVAVAIAYLYLWNEYSTLIYQYIDLIKQYIEYVQMYVLPSIMNTLVEIVARILVVIFLLLGWALFVFEPHIVWHWGRR